MKTFLMLTVALLGVALVGCENSAADRQADSIRDSSQNAAETVRDTTQEQAEQVRDAAGRDVLGNAKPDSAERKADNIEAAGERKADAIESEGERKADAVEENKDPNAPK